MSAWVDQIFTAQQVRNGGVVRRARWYIDQARLDEIIDRATDRGWHVIETGDQIVVLCHEGSLIIHC